MKNLIMVVLSLCGTVAQAQYTQWYFWVPQESVVVEGVYGDHNQPLIEGYDVSDLELSEYLPFPIPDPNAITGMTLEPDGEGYALWLSLASPWAGYLPGDVIRCAAGNCVLAFSTSQDLMVEAKVGVDALGLNDNAQLLLSFDMGFEFGGGYIDPLAVYSVGTVSGDLVLVEQSNGQSLGMAQTSNMTSYASSNNGQGFTFYYGGNVPYSRPNEFIFPMEMLVINSQNPSGYFAFGLTEEVNEISAFHGLTTGNMDFAGLSVEVAEDAGGVDIPVNRSGGFEGFVRIRLAVLNGGTAIENDDFEIVSPTVQWLDDESGTLNIQVNILDNFEQDGQRNAFFVLEADSQFASISGLSSSFELVITDDDGDLIFADGFD